MFEQVDTTMFYLLKLLEVTKKWTRLTQCVKFCWHILRIAHRILYNLCLFVPYNLGAVNEQFEECVFSNVWNPFWRIPAGRCKLNYSYWAHTYNTKSTLYVHIMDVKKISIAVVNYKVFVFINRWNTEIVCSSTDSPQCPQYCSG